MLKSTIPKNFFLQEVGGDQGGSNNSTGGQFFVDPSGH